MHLTRRIRICPTKNQIITLWALSDLCRLTYNFALSERKEMWEKEHKTVSYFDQSRKLPNIKEKYPEYKQVNAKVLQTVLRTLDANYRSFFVLIKKDPMARPPRFIGKKYFFTIKYSQNGFKIGNTEISLSHNIKDGAELEFQITTYEKFTNVKQIEVHFNDGKWYLSIVDEINTPKYHDNGLYQSFDLGITKQTAVNLSGKFFEKKNIRPDLYWNKTIDKITSRRDHCKKGSKKYKFLNGIKRKFEKKRGNQILDFQHKTSLMIVKNTKANTIIVGDLDVKRMAQSRRANRGMNRSTQGTGYLARFTGFLTYKAERIGKKVIEIGERNTTITCCCCGKIHDMPLSKRVMKCDCGNEIDRDKNSTVNIMVRYLSQNAMCTGYQQFVDNLRTGSGVNILPEYSQELL